MSAQKLYKIISGTAGARLNCLAIEKRDGKPHDWTARHREAIETLVKEFMPSGSGIDNGVTFDFDSSTSEKLVFNFSFHHMNEHGYYDGWTEHTLTVKPSLQFDFEITISGRNKNAIKEYLHETFSSALEDLIDYDGENFFSPALRQAQLEFAAKIKAGEIS